MKFATPIIEKIDFSATDVISTSSCYQYSCQTNTSCPEDRCFIVCNPKCNNPVCWDQE